MLPVPEHQQTQQSKKSDTIFQKQAAPLSQIPASNPYSIIQRAKINPKSLTHADVMQLQRTIGNRAVGRLLSEIGLIPSTAKPVQRQEIPEEEEPLQGKIIETIQRQEIPKEEESLQGKLIGTIQRQEIPEEEESLQTKKENNTGMPDNLKAGVENLSGIDMSDVRVYYNSSKPAEVGALAYTQGTNIHVAPGQERHLPHEAWHVVQQTHGRVKPTMQLKDGVQVNDDKGLEHEADEMGAKALGSTVQRHGPEKEKLLLRKFEAMQRKNLEKEELLQKRPSEILKKGALGRKVSQSASAQSYLTNVSSHHPIQRAILKNDNDVHSLVHTFLALKNNLILRASEDDIVKLVKYLDKKVIRDALDVLRETDSVYNSSEISGVISKKLASNRLIKDINDQIAQMIANALSMSEVSKANVTSEDAEILNASMEMSGYITTDRKRAEIKRQASIKTEIEDYKKEFGNYAETFTHIFKGEFSRDGTPTGYHSEVVGSSTHSVYGAITNLDHHTYQQSVKATPPRGVSAKKKPFQSTFFPDTASEDDVKLAVVSGDKNANKTVKYPESMKGMPLKRTGVTIYPNTGADMRAEES